MSVSLPRSKGDNSTPITLHDELSRMNAKDPFGNNRALQQAQQETIEIIGRGAFSKVNNFLAQYGC